MLSDGGVSGDCGTNYRHLPPPSHHSWGRNIPFAQPPLTPTNKVTLGQCEIDSAIFSIDVNSRVASHFVAFWLHFRFVLVGVTQKLPACLLISNMICTLSCRYVDVVRQSIGNAISIAWRDWGIIHYACSLNASWMMLEASQIVLWGVFFTNPLGRDQYNSHFVLHRLLWCFKASF